MAKKKKAATKARHPAKKPRKPSKPARPSRAHATKSAPAKAPAKAPPRRPVAPAKLDGKAAAKKPHTMPSTGVVLPPAPAVEAPGKFRREYRKWKEVLISLRHRLLSEGSHLEEEGLKALEQEVSVDHMADFGSDSSEQETTLQLIENNSLSLRDVDDALKRIEMKRYGLCEDCEKLIPPARLTVLPHARLCIDCQSKREGMPA